MPDSIRERVQGDPSRISAPAVDVGPVRDNRFHRDLYLALFTRLATVTGPDGMSVADAHRYARKAADYAVDHYAGPAGTDDGEQQ